ncbi:MAG: SDR family oxidoreductase [Myxococcota bacterium]
MNQGEGKVTIITGASSGIGLESARLFAKRGDRLVLAARRKERLEKLAEELKKFGTESLVAPIDLADSQNSGTLIEIAMDKWGRVDTLVNNAGFSLHTLFEKMSCEDIENMLNVNVKSLILLTHKAIPIMKRQGAGSIVNVASVVGFVPFPLNTLYTATKHSVVGFTKSLNLELKGSGVRVVAVCPPAVATEFFEVATRDIAFPKFFYKTAISPKKVARSVIRASEKGGAIAFPSFLSPLYILTERWFTFIYNFFILKFTELTLKQK